MTRKYRLLSGIVFVLLMIGASSVHAQLLCNPCAKTDPGFWEFGGFGTVGKVEYDVEDMTDSGEVERTVLGGYGARGISDRVDFFCGLGYIASAEVDAVGADEDGTGFMAAVGLRSRFDTMTAMNVSAYGQLHHINETYGTYNVSHLQYYNGRLYSASSSEADYEGAITELLLGICGRCELDEMNVYGTLEVIPLSNAELDTAFTSYDAERDSLITLRVGMDMNVGDGVLRGEIGLVGEETFTIAYGKQF